MYISLAHISDPSFRKTVRAPFCPTTSVYPRSDAFYIISIFIILIPQPRDAAQTNFFFSVTAEVTG